MILRAAAFWFALASANPIRQIDFGNFSYPWHGRTDAAPDSWGWLARPAGSVRLMNGRCSFDASGPHGAKLVLQTVAFGDLTGDKRDEAAVHLRYSNGGTASWSYLYLYTSGNGSPELLGMLRSGSRADGGLIRVAIRDSRLVLDFADADRRIADCCSEGWVRVRYAWRKGRLIEDEHRDYGDLK